MSDNYSGSQIFPAEDPYQAQPQQPGWADADPTAMLPPVPPQAGPEAQGWDTSQPPPSSSFSQIHEKYATTEVPVPQQAFQPQQPDASWPEHWTQPAEPGPVQAPPAAWQPQQPQPGYASAAPVAHPYPATDAPYGTPPGYPTAPGGYSPQGQGQAEQTTLLPPVPADYGVLPPQQHGYAVPPGAQPYPQGQAAEQTTLLPPVPAGYTGSPQEPGQGGYPTPLGAQPFAEPLAPGATGWSDAQLAYGVPSSLRETFAAAQPTGPVGAATPPPPPPLDTRLPNGSLRQAFAAAQPTGPTAGPVAHPGAHPAVAPGVPAAVVRTGSPIIDPGIQPAAATLGLAVLLALAALLGRYGLVLPVLLLQAVTAAGWFRLNGMWPARQGIALAALGGFTADAAALAASGGTAPAVLAGTLGGFFLLVLILQIFRPSNPDERFYALTVSASATVMTVLAGCFLAAGTLTHHGWTTGAAVTAGALAAGVATAVSAVPGLPAKVDFAAGGFAGLAAGTVLGALLGTGLGGGLLLGLAAGVCALVGRRVAAYDFPSRFVHLTAGVVLPLACAAPAVFLVGHLIAG